MQPVVPVGQWSLGLLSPLMLAVLLSGFFVVLFAVRRSPPTVQAVAKFAVVIIAVLVIGGFFWTTPVQFDRLEHSSSTPATIAPRVAFPAAGDALATGESESAKPNPELPEWTRQSSRSDGASKFVVVKSGRFATLEEAELHALDEASQAAALHFRNLDPSGVGHCSPFQRELVRESAIRDRYDEISRHDFGTMKDFPMHQLWLRVELSPQLGQRIAEPWRKAAVEARLRTLTVWSIWSTAAAALIAFSMRLDSVWNGRRRAVVVGTTIALMLGSLAFVA